LSGFESPFSAAMRTPHTILFLAYDGCQLLDVTGPATVFGLANSTLAKQIYDVRLVSPAGGLVATTTGIELQARPLAETNVTDVHTFLVAGGLPAAMRKVCEAEVVRRWISRYAQSAGRIGSICSGTFILAELGAIAGKRVATHWASCERLACSFPQLTVDSDALFVEDGKVWTSAGITAGIDMALAMVERDAGRELANSIAKFLVLYVRRPGH